MVDIGVGTGIGLPFLGDFSPVVGVDGSIGMLKIAQKQIIDGEINQECVSLVCASATALPFRGGVFSSTLCVTVIQNIQELDTGVGELLRIIQPPYGRLGLTWLAKALSMNRVIPLVTGKMVILTSLYKLAGEDDGLILQLKAQ
jgi:ubiquinone/menaquinone biosynthesis C-methylase UbiE